jgi:methyltransferase (TIGR00027 family)
VKRQTSSRTAAVIAASQAFMRHDPFLGELVSATSAHYCQTFVGYASKPLALLSKHAAKPWLHRMIYFIERCVLPGIMLHFAVRKRYLREQVTASIGHGCTQIVVLGAGFDTLALELSEQFPAIRFFELDTPATQSVKLRALRDMGVKPHNLYFIPIDLGSECLADVLLSSGIYSVEANTVVIAEGLFMYLESAAIENLFSELKGIGHRVLCVIFTFLELQGNGNPDFQQSSNWLRLALRRWKEPFKWGKTRTELDAFLRQLGFAARWITEDDTLAARYLVPLNAFDRPLAKGEYLCAAELSEFTDANPVLREIAS